jgi:membrane carboxypeptidase/penicillin-binding protein
VEPHLITRVEDGDGASIWTDMPGRHQAVTVSTAFLMSSMLADVVSSGTATGARAAGFKLPAAGKTGTTDDYSDAWFVGYTPHLVAGVWFGLDRPAPIMNRGFAGVVAVPAWADFMKRATAGDRADWFQAPADVEKIAICRTSGLLATEACRLGWTGVEHVQAGLTDMPGEAVGTAGRAAAPSKPRSASTVYEDYFTIGSVPTEPCPVHGASDTPPGSGISGSLGSGDAALGTSSTAGTLPASYQPPASTVQRVVGADGRITWVIRNQH